MSNSFRLALLVLCGFVASAATVAAAGGAAVTENPPHFPTDHPHFLTAEEAVGRVLELEDARLAIMPAVAAAKWRNPAAIRDPERERKVVEHAVELGSQMGLAAQPVQAIFELQIRFARDLQTNLHERWREHGFDYDESDAGLSAQIRPRLDALTQSLLKAMYLAASFTHDPQFAAHHRELARSLLHAEGWSDDSRAELLAALARLERDPGPRLPRITSAGVLRVATTGDYAPFSLEADGQLSGVDIDLAQKLGRQLGVEVVFVRTAWGTLLDDLQRDVADVEMSGISITPAREEGGAFSLPYSEGGKTIMGRCRDARRYQDLAAVDRRGVRIVVNPGGTNEQYVRANVHRARVLVHADNRTIFDELLAGRADVMITDDVEVEMQTHRHPDLCRTDPGILTYSQKAILMPREAALIGAVNGWLGPELASGKPASLLQQYLRR